jgi:hypothetical protein
MLTDRGFFFDQYIRCPLQPDGFTFNALHRLQAFPFARSLLVAEARDWLDAPERD